MSDNKLCAIYWTSLGVFAVAWTVVCMLVSTIK